MTTTDFKEIIGQAVTLNIQKWLDEFFLPYYDKIKYGENFSDTEKEINEETHDYCMDIVDEKIESWIINSASNDGKSGIWQLELFNEEHQILIQADSEMIFDTLPPSDELVILGDQNEENN